MKTRFTYKEVSLIIGILVAAIIAITFWIGEFPIRNQTQNTSLLPQLSLVQDHPVDFLKQLLRHTNILR
jgi:hypothetical protein